MSVVELKNFMVTFGIKQMLNDGAPSILTILEKLNFSAVANLLIKEGTYTPNNDYLYLWQSIPAEIAPNFIFIQTPKPLNVTITANNQPICNAVPANKLFILALPPSGIAVDNVYIEGRTNAAAPMAQNDPVDYFCLMAQAVF